MDAAAHAQIIAAADRFLDRICEQVTVDAQRLAPVDTGRLRANIHAERTGEGTVRVTADAPYAGYVELGTSKQSAHPFLRPALYQRRG